MFHTEFLLNILDLEITQPLKYLCEILFDIKADSYAYEKLIRKWTKSVFFGFFRSYGYENGPDSYGQIRLSFS